MKHDKPHGLMFHHFHNKNHARSQGSIDANDFRKMILFYGPDNFVSPHDWILKCQHNQLKESDVCLTFDDNLLSQYDVALPVMEEFGIKGFWFVYTSVVKGQIQPLEIYRTFRSSFENMDVFYDEFFQILKDSPEFIVHKPAIEKFDVNTFLVDFPFYSDNDKKFRFIRDEVLTPSEYNNLMDLLMINHSFSVEKAAEKLWMKEQHIKELSKKGHMIGLHSHTHPTRMESLSPEVQVHEYKTNYFDIEKITGIKPESMSHPCNSYSPETLKILDSLDIKIGFRANLAQKSYSSYELPRIDHAIILKQMNNVSL